MVKDRKWVIVLALTAALLSGCGEKPTETVYQHLEAAVELEAPFEEQQEPLQAAEVKENELFEDIIALGISDMEKITELADEALASIDSRLAMIETEKESIERSYAEFELIKPVQDEMEDEQLSSLLEELIVAMDNRYEHYQKLYEAYVTAAKEDEALFTMLKQEDLTMEELQAQIDGVNASYEVVAKEKEQFNQYTDEYNEKKRLFYETADLEVRFE
nr:YkyA family protein [Halalkalibacter oceani]